MGIKGDEMKALEILVRITRTPQDLFRYSDKELDDAIAELELLQQPKSCDDCRSKSCSVKRILLELGEINSSYFYCNDYEPKE